MIKLNAFTSVNSFLFFKGTIIEELLQALIGIVDTQLFKTVRFKDFKSENIQETNELIALAGQTLI